jgi:hypothetical protein
MWIYFDKEVVTDWFYFCQHPNLLLVINNTVCTQLILSYGKTTAEFDCSISNVRDSSVGNTAWAAALAQGGRQRAYTSLPFAITMRWYIVVQVLLLWKLPGISFGWV